MSPFSPVHIYSEIHSFSHFTSVKSVWTLLVILSHNIHFFIIFHQCINYDLSKAYHNTDLIKYDGCLMKYNEIDSWAVNLSFWAPG